MEGKLFKTDYYVKYLFIDYTIILIHKNNKEKDNESQPEQEALYCE